MKQAYFLAEPQAVELLKSYNIPYPEHGVARNEQEAVQIAEAIGYPVVLKVVSPQVIHKSDAGGVKVNLRDAGEVREAYRGIVWSVHNYDSSAAIEGMIVAKNAPKGQEVIIGLIEDDIFGKTLMFGLGGVLTELINDVRFKVCPVAEKDAALMIREIKSAQIIDGFRGSAPLDTTSLTDLLVKVSKMVMENQDIRELDLNPVVVYEQGLLVLDARIMKEMRDPA